MKPAQHILQIPPYRVEPPLEEIIRMASNENCYGPSPKVIEAMQLALPFVHRYANENGYRLREAISRKLQVPISQIILGNGSTELIDLIARTYLTAGTNAITANQTFLMYKIAVLSTGAMLREVPTRNFSYDLSAILEVVDASTRVLYIADPNNPTGLTLNKAELERFLAKVPSHVVVVLDEAYREYILDDDFPDGLLYLSNYPNLFVLRTFSKVHSLAGLRIGYGIASEEILDSLNRIRAPYNTNNVAQAAALAALEDESHVQMSCEQNQIERAYLQAELTKLDIRFVPSLANFILLILADAQNVGLKLREKGVHVRWMQRFNVPDGLRVTIGTHDQNVAFVKALGSAG